MGLYVKSKAKTAGVKPRAARTDDSGAARGLGANTNTRVRNGDASLRTMIEALPAVPFSYRYGGPDDHGFVYIAPQCRKLLGKSAAVLLRDPRALSPVIDDAAAFEAGFFQAMALGRRARFEGRFPVGRGEVKWLSVSADPVEADRGLNVFAGLITDIDTSKRIEIEFESTRERIGRAEEIAEFGWYDYNVRDGILDLTPEFAVRLGLPNVPGGHLSGQVTQSYVEGFRQAVHPDDRERYRAIMQDPAWQRTEFDFRMVKPSGEIRNLFIRVHRTTDREGKRLRDFAVILDITERKRLEENLRALASTDPLTGVPNRRTFESVGRREMERARRYAKPFTLIALDIDHFKKVNDTHGHDVGDAVLKDVAKACSAQLRGTDIFARLGGEEFAALLPETDIKAASGLADRLRQGIALQPIFSAKGPLVVTVSVGVAEYTPQETGLDQVLKRADEALYAAKRNGRNRVEIAPPPARPAAE
jgi:diguanylate cyclase (GGDEF)-like protein